MSQGFRSVLFHLLLLLLTFVTVTLAGVQWLNKDPLELENFFQGLTYGTLIVLFLLSHELGHYFAARTHKVQATLPFFIPFPFLSLAPFGTLGAVIRIKSPVTSRQVLFDIGASGPIAGFVVSVVLLVVGFRTLPALDYLYGIHPEYAKLSVLPKDGLAFGQNLLYWCLSKLVPPTTAFVPPMNEMYHYPYLCVGWFGLFVTSMNLIPVAQLDGGHITLALFGRLHQRIAQLSMLVLMVLGTLGALSYLGYDIGFGWVGWLIWTLILALFLRTRRLQRVDLPEPTESIHIGTRRSTFGWFCVLIFILSFVPTPFS